MNFHTCISSREGHGVSSFTRTWNISVSTVISYI